MENKGYGFTVWGFNADPISDNYGKPKVYGRFNTKKELDDFLEEINREDSGWLPEELCSIRIEDSKNFSIPF